MYKRPVFKIIHQRVQEPRRLIFVIAGPRQIGKTTLVHQLLNDLNMPHHFASADETFSNNSVWIDQQWETSRFKLKQSEAHSFLLVIDEIQKISDWSRTVKYLWDKDTREQINIKVILLGSSQLMLKEGLTESLAGRFEMIPMCHWSLHEMRAAFNFGIEQYIWFGGYPGAAQLIADEPRWKNYVRNSLIETTISKDILQMTRIHKPALLRQLFEFGCHYSSRIVSYNKVLGQLADAGNTTTLTHYLNLLGSAGLLSGLENYANTFVRKKSSSPKFQVWNTALVSALKTEGFSIFRMQPADWGWLVESAVGSHLLNAIKSSQMKLYYWRRRNEEVDFVLQRGTDIIGIEVKSGQSGKTGLGMVAFQAALQPHRTLLVGGSGIPLEDFLLTEPEKLF